MGTVESANIGTLLCGPSKQLSTSHLQTTLPLVAAVSVPSAQHRRSLPNEMATSPLLLNHSPARGTSAPAQSNHLLQHLQAGTRTRDSLDYAETALQQAYCIGQRQPLLLLCT
jgi:hypothetical protein